MNYFELFAGAGGCSLGLERAGLACVGHAEITEHARSVLRHHWPDVPLLGDVRAITGGRKMRRWVQERFRGRVDLVAGGSPCQDLSIAGRRAGLAGVRSSLFFRQVRFWRLLDAPYLLWENVAGALSSNGGQDFATVLSTLVGTPLAVPPEGWRRGGVASGPTAVAAWRVCDLRYFGADGLGVPQRRDRVFVVAAHAGGVDPSEVLALGQGLCRHPDPREAQGESPAGPTPQSFALRGRGLETRDDGTVNALMTPNGGRHGIPSGDGLLVPMPPAGIAVRGPFGGWTEQPTTGSLCARDGKSPSQVALQSLANGSPVAATLTTDLGTKQGQDNQHVNNGCPLFVLSSSQANATLGDGLVNTMDTMHEQPIVFVDRPRRLMPVECERLMGWPDDWTAQGRRADGTVYALKDTPRYTMIGNGCGAPQAEWIGRQLLHLHGGDHA